MILVDEARKILLQAMCKVADNEYPHVWVSELLKETGEEYFFDVNFYAEGEGPENAEDPPVPWAVNKHSGEVQCYVDLQG